MLNEYSSYYYDENSLIAQYNNELWYQFIEYSENYFNLMPQVKRKELIQSLDLLRAINSYRTYNNYQDFFNAYPDLADQEEYVKLLWNHFESLSEEQLSDLAIQMIHEVSI